MRKITLDPARSLLTSDETPAALKHVFVSELLKGEWSALLEPADDGDATPDSALMRALQHLLRTRRLVRLLKKDGRAVVAGAEFHAACLRVLRDAHVRSTTLGRSAGRLEMWLTALDLLEKKRGALADLRMIVDSVAALPRAHGRVADWQVGLGAVTATDLGTMSSQDSVRTYSKFGESTDPVVLGLAGRVTERTNGTTWPIRLLSIGAIVFIALHEALKLAGSDEERDVLGRAAPLVIRSFPNARVRVVGFFEHVRATFVLLARHRATECHAIELYGAAIVCLEPDVYDKLLDDMHRFLAEPTGPLPMGAAYIVCAASGAPHNPAARVVAHSLRALGAECSGELDCACERRA